MEIKVSSILYIILTYYTLTYFNHFFHEKKPLTYNFRTRRSFIITFRFPAPSSFHSELSKLAAANDTDVFRRHRCRIRVHVIDIPGKDAFALFFVSVRSISISAFIIYCTYILEFVYGYLVKSLVDSVRCGPSQVRFPQR